MLAFKTITPLLNRVLIKKAEVPIQKSAGGIILSQDKDKLSWGKVISVGPGKKGEDGKVIPVDVKVGQDVLLPEWGGSKVTLKGGEEFYIYRDDDIVGILKND